LQWLNTSPDLEARHDVYNAATAVATKFDGASGKRKQGVILAATYVVTWVEVGATLANQDFTGVHKLATKALNT
jgi:hypothetical protein